MRKQMWEIRQSDNPKVLKLYIYGEVTGGRYYDWNTDTMQESETSAKHFKEALEQAGDITEIEIYINSYGGSVFEGTAIRNQLKRHPAHKTVYVDGFACSIAANIATCGDKVIMYSNSMMMIHEAWIMAVGNPGELRKAADDLEKINEGNRMAFLEKAGDKLDEDTLKEMLKNETWLTAEDCVNYGLADEIAAAGTDGGSQAALASLRRPMQAVGFPENDAVNLANALTRLLMARQCPSAPNPNPEKKPEPEPGETGNKPLNFLQALMRG